jgi:chemotaxis protein histidine kinase CheA
LKESYGYTQSIFTRIGESLRKRLLGVAFTQKEFLQLKESARSGDLSTVQKLIEAVEKIESLKLVANWSDEAAKIGASLGKEVLVTIEGDGGAIPKRVFENLDSVLIHLLRNSLDHGIETPEQRSESGKEPTSIIHVRLDADDKRLHFEIADDGRGINFDELGDQAKSNERLDPAAIDRFIAAGEPWRILFMTGFTTSTEVTEISGRGVGLSAIKSLVDSCHGQIAVESKPGHGAVFKIDIPVSEAA